MNKVTSRDRLQKTATLASQPLVTAEKTQRSAKGIKSLQVSIAAMLQQADASGRLEDWVGVIESCEAAIAQAEKALRLEAEVPETKESKTKEHKPTNQKDDMPVAQCSYEETQMSLARSFQQSGDIDAAVEAYLSVLKKNPHWYEAYNKLRYNLMRYDIEAGAPVLETVVAVCEDVIKHHPGLQFAHITLGYALTKLGRIKEANDCFSNLGRWLLHDHLKDSQTAPELLAALSAEMTEGSVPSLQRRTPNFMIIGAEKCGTTSLFQYVRRHPAVLSPIEKEIDFFDIEYDYGLDWYLSHFPPSLDSSWDKSNTITGETSPNYLYSNVAPARVAKHFPSLQLVVILRHPVDRVISRYEMMVRNGAESRSFKASINQEMRLLKRMIANGKMRWPVLNRCRYLGNSLYYYHLKRWLNHFPDEQLLVLKSESLFFDPEGTMQHLYSTLGLPELSEQDRANQSYPKYNAGAYTSAVPIDVQQQLFDFFEPHTQKLESLLNRSFEWRRP